MINVFLCKPKKRASWCRHLVVAGKKLPIFVTSLIDGTKGLHSVINTRETGRKKPKKMIRMIL